MSFKYQTREEWLAAAYKLLSPRFSPHGTLPKKIHILTSFPYGTKKAIGMKFHDNWTEDKSIYIAISPELGGHKITEVLDTLIHEMIHALGISKHGKDFKKIALALGLEGPMKSTSASKELKEELEELAKTLGNYPHTVMKPAKVPKKAGKKQILKFKCTEDESYTVWVTPKQAALHGPPISPISKKLMVEA